MSTVRSIARTTGLATLVGLGSACYATAGAEPVYVTATTAPVAYEGAPQYDYEGRRVYYVNDRWYARDRGNWVYYRSEPPPLARYRTHVQVAPRAPERSRVVVQPRRGVAPRAEPEHREAAPDRREAAPDRREAAPRARPHAE